MKTRNISEEGSAFAIIVIIIGVVIILGGLTYVFWNNFLKKDQSQAATNSNTASSQQSTKSKPCADGEDLTASSGTFCSETVGTKFSVPAIFKGKLAKADNYEVFQGPIDPNGKTSAGFSESVFIAKITGNDNVTLTIAQEPLRSGYVDVSHLLKQTYFNKETNSLNAIDPGSTQMGEQVPSSTIDSIKFYRASTGDAGTRIVTYVGVVKDKLVKVQLDHRGYIGDPAHDPSTINGDTLFDEFDKNIKQLKLV